MKNKVIKWIIRVLIAIVLLFVLILSAFSLGEKIVFSDFYKNSEKYERSPGLWEGYVHQGYTSIDEDTRLSCGYMSNDKPSRVYILKNDQDESFVELQKATGEPYM